MPTITRVKLKNQIYEVCEKFTSCLYRDNSWLGVDRIIHSIKDLTKDSGYEAYLSVEDGGYRTSKDGMSHRKEYLLTIEDTETEIPELRGTITCHSAGTEEDPWKRYDVTLVLWLTNKSEEIKMKAV